jgi:hypothetical protein
MGPVVRLIGSAALLLFGWLGMVAAGVWLFVHSRSPVSLAGFLLLFSATALLWLFGSEIGAALLDWECRLPLTAHLAMVVSCLALLIAAWLGAGPVYHATYGERADAIIVDKAETVEETRCRISHTATERDLGWVTGGPCERSGPGDRIEVSVDPRGWAAPLTADGLRHARLFTTTLLVSSVALIASTACGTAVAAVGLRNRRVR